MSKVKSFVAYSDKQMTLFVWALTIIISALLACTCDCFGVNPTTYMMHSLNRSLYVLVQCYGCQAGFYTGGVKLGFPPQAEILYE